MHSVRIAGTMTQVSVGKILCVGRNYADHAREMMAEIPEEPVVFLKPSTALLSNGHEIVRPAISRELHHEVELVVVLGTGGKNIAASDARSHILGYAVGLDMTLRDLQSAAKKKGLPWSIAKGFDTSAPVSEVIPAARVVDPGTLRIRCTVNGTVRQDASVQSMMFSAEQLIQFISTVFTLEAGDLIFTGTPEGVGEVKPGDRIEAELVGFTSIAHTVRSEAV